MLRELSLSPLLLLLVLPLSWLWQSSPRRRRGRLWLRRLSFLAGRLDLRLVERERVLALEAGDLEVGRRLDFCEVFSRPFAVGRLPL